jgi:hypothetical protein
MLSNLSDLVETPFYFKTYKIFLINEINLKFTSIINANISCVHLNLSSKLALKSRTIRITDHGSAV